MLCSLSLFVFGFRIVLPRPSRGALLQDFQEGSYVPPVTLKRGDLYINGWILDWWRHKFPSRTLDDLVEYVAHDYCEEISMFGPSNVGLFVILDSFVVYVTMALT